MGATPPDYRALTREALCAVMARAMSHAAEHGLFGEQHFLVRFQTQHPGVVMPEWLRAQFPEEILVVIQHEYWDLAVMDDRFSVGLSFNQRPCTIVVPFAAVMTFADPSVDFQLQLPFGGGAGAVMMPEDDDEDEPAQASPAPAPDATEEAAAADEAGSTEAGTVVSLDSFRKK